MNDSFHNLLVQRRAQVATIDAKTLASNLSTYVIVDVREEAEVADGVIPGAVHLSRGLLELQIESVIRDRRSQVVLYCAGGTRSTLACHTLAELGYPNTYSLDGGIKAWKDEGLPVTIRRGVDALALQRYGSQIRLPQVGNEGQQKLQDARVLLVGAGGLGSPAALYLAAAGVGTIGIIDDDRVDLSNLQRQILHTTERVGMPKVESAFLALKALNPTIDVRMHAQRLNRDNVDEVLPSYDVVVDGCDNFQTRYLVNDACLKHRKINMHGSVFWFQGQLSVFCAPDGPCYRCLYPDPPAADLAPNCADAGVLGALPGLIGVLQALETLKVILGIGASLVGRLLVVDALTMQFRTLKIRRDPECQYCNAPQQIKYQEYAQQCAVRAE